MLALIGTIFLKISEVWNCDSIRHKSVQVLQDAVHEQSSRRSLMFFGVESNIIFTRERESPYISMV
jgi:hypothetical protein